MEVIAQLPESLDIVVDVIIVLIGIWLIFTLFGDAARVIKRLLKRKKDQCK